ncbi:hypothetical protein P875_00053405 [Aspergillus parasiticus SU-1]|uniref:Uncharacterized protein n=1 Tax=Aspergillus parasiticus (strain ATCC 56775 / NRRL 5862 / SRRC 143 / SU-1) TaxID=1403190 RepID=A0A0F0I3A0_ASPPU|nr:hypothetical protein P875_00053405 [Aspergillus parasiticus SU-1]
MPKLDNFYCALCGSVFSTTAVAAPMRASTCGGDFYADIGNEALEIVKMGYLTPRKWVEHRDLAENSQHVRNAERALAVLSGQFQHVEVLFLIVARGNKLPRPDRSTVADFHFLKILFMCQI